MGNQVTLSQDESEALNKYAYYKSRRQPPYMSAFVDGDLQDNRRNKQLQFRLYYPKGGKEGMVCPVIVFSHGLLGNREGYQGLGETLSGWGYVVIHPTHADSLKQKREQQGAMSLFKDGGIKGHIQRELNPPQKWVDRVADLSFLIDSLEELQALPKKHSNTILVFDQEQIGVGGHSYGAYTTQLIGGAKVELKNALTGEELQREREKEAEDSKEEEQEKEREIKLHSLADSRVKATLAISPQGISSPSYGDWGGLREHSWDDYRTPLMLITGTNDRDFAKREPQEAMAFRAHPYRYSRMEPKYNIVIDGADHGMGGFSSAPWFGKMLGWKESPYHVALVLTATLAFFDAHVKEEEEAIAYLQQQDIPLFAFESSWQKK